MNIYLNDLSLNCDKDILENWNEVKKFNDLLSKLAGINNLQFHAPGNLWDRPILGFNVKTKTLFDRSTIPKDHSNLLRIIYSKFLLIKDELPHFAEDDRMTIPSSTVGLAAEQSAPVISFTFDEKYKTDSLSGWLKNKEDSIFETKVNNIYEDKSANYQLIVDLTPCRRLNPLEEPMWNKKLVQKLLKEENLINLDTSLHNS